jgi:hypothetical protein
MSTMSWTVAPTGYLDSRGFDACPFAGGDAGRSVPPLAPARRSGQPVPGSLPSEALIGFRMGTAAPYGTYITRFNGTTLGIPSPRRPLS